MKKTFHKPYDDVYKACRDALRDLEIEIVNASKKRGTINGETEFSLFSWGEEIQINLYRKNDGITEVTVESVSQAQLFDWGRNESNEKKILSKLSKLLNNSK